MSISSILEEDFVTLPVPKRLYPEIVRVLAAAMKQEEATPIQSPELEPAEAASVDWTKVGNMKRLRKGLKSLVAIKLLDMTAARPEVKIPFDEIFTAAGYTETRRAGSSLGSMTKIIKRDFGLTYEKSVWPVEHHWAINDDAQYYYLMPEAVAKAWLQSAI